ncbi:MAG TPA: FHA domain-containing protein [Anaerolineae bacterium]|nr:FHA domain-containing protein [Anaerolineae bacterium]
MKCPHCGAELMPDDDRCAQCGTEVSSSPSTGLAEESTSSKEMPEQDSTLSETIQGLPLPDDFLGSTLIQIPRLPRLVITAGVGEGREFKLRAKATVGRAPDNDIILEDPKVSRHHAVIAFTEERYSITDLESANGTFVNGIRIRESHPLRAEDVISLGDTELTFYEVPPSKTALTKPFAQPVPRFMGKVPTWAWMAGTAVLILCLVAVGVMALLRGSALLEGKTATGQDTPAALARLTLIYSDDFNDSETGWGEFFEPDTVRQYGGSRYHIIAKENDVFTWSKLGRDFTDFVLEVDATQDQGPSNNGYGLLFRSEDDEHFYRFGISGDGFYFLDKSVGGEWVPVIDWTESPYINRGQASNRLKVTCAGPQITLHVNDQYLATATDDSYDHGDIGLFAISFAEPNVHITFDNLKVWAAKGTLAVPLTPAKPTDESSGP